ncbi:hypothetical protein GW17_00031545 [Ensete ventricosum]|nr:hypothetical protein GW17_00031545 [Ensete ventricosum]
MIGAAGELDCFSAHIRLRELGKSEDKAECRSTDSRAMGLAAPWYRRGRTFVESSIPCSHGGRALVVKGAEEPSNIAFSTTKGIGEVEYPSSLTYLAGELCTSSIVEFISVLLTTGSEAVETELIQLGAIKRVIELFFLRPTTLQEPARDSDDEDFRDRDFDVAALASNLSQAFRCGIYTNDDIEEDVYFDDESAEVVISSLRLGDDQDSPLFTNSNWFAFENDREVDDDRLTNSLASSSPNSDETSDDEPDEEVVVGENNNLNDTATSLQVMDAGTASESKAMFLGNGPANEPKEGVSNSSIREGEQSPGGGWVEWRETSEPKVPGTDPTSDILNSDGGSDKETVPLDEVALEADECGLPLGVAAIDRRGGDAGGSSDVLAEVPSDTAKGGGDFSGSPEVINESNLEPPESEAAAENPQSEKDVDTDTGR